MASDKGDSNSMFNLGKYYRNVKKNYQNTVKYYLMAVEKGHVDAMYGLGNYYRDVEKDYPNGVPLHRHLRATEKI